MNSKSESNRPTCIGFLAVVLLMYSQDVSCSHELCMNYSALHIQAFINLRGNVHTHASILNDFITWLLLKWLNNCKDFCVFIVGLITFHKTRLHIRYRSLITMNLRWSEYLYILQPASVHLDTTALWRVKMDTLVMGVGSSANVMTHKHVNRISDVLQEAIIIMV